MTSHPRRTRWYQTHTKHSSVNRQWMGSRLALLLLAPALMVIGAGCGSKATPSATRVPRVVPSPTVEPTALPPTAVPSPAPTQVRTLVPTLSAREREARLRELLKTNGGCALPCLWGIAPGTTSSELAWKTLLEIGAGEHFPPGEDPTTGEGTGSFFAGSADAGVHTVERDGIVRSIDLYAADYQNPFSLQSDWSAYSLSAILSMYGVPSRVFLEAAVEPAVDPNTRRYAVWLYYDHLGFAIRYGGSATVLEDVVRICPGWAGPGGMDTIRLLVQAADAATPVEALTGYTENQLAYVWPLEYAVGLTAEDLHALFTEGDGLECVEMPMAASGETPG